jgi:hypothetical protein
MPEAGHFLVAVHRAGWEEKHIAAAQESASPAGFVAGMAAANQHQLVKILVPVSGGHAAFIFVHPNPQRQLRVLEKILG